MWVRGDFLASQTTPQEERKKSEKTKMNTNLVVRCERQLSIALIRYTMTSVMTVLFHPVMLRQQRGGGWIPFQFVPRTSYCRGMRSPGLTPNIKASAKSHPPLAVLYLTSSPMYRHVL